MSTLLIMAGGTGGHVYPALAVAERLRELGVKVVWLGTRRGLEARVVPAADIPIEWVRIRGLRGSGWLRRLTMPFVLVAAVIQCVAVVLRVRPVALLGMGGFVAGPGGLAAWVLRKPLLIHESNADAGMTNRWLARLADRVMAGFPGAFGERVAVEVTGNPVRKAIAGVPAPERRLRGREGRLRLLVVGGSQGARVFNTTVAEALAAMPAESRAEVLHQCGRDHAAETRATYDAHGVDGRVEEFIEDMAAAYEWADVVLCRAGAMTVSELAAAGAASILVPYPFAAGDHQSYNARFLAAAGAAIVVPQSEYSPARLAEVLAQLANQRGQVLEMARNARAEARFDATDRVVAICREALDA